MRRAYPGTDQPYRTFADVDNYVVAGVYGGGSVRHNSQRRIGIVAPNGVVAVVRLILNVTVRAVARQTDCVVASAAQERGICAAVKDFIIARARVKQYVGAVSVEEIILTRARIDCDAGTAIVVTIAVVDRIITFARIDCDIV